MRIEPEAGGVRTAPEVELVVKLRPHSEISIRHEQLQLSLLLGDFLLPTLGGGLGGGLGAKLLAHLFFRSLQLRFHLPAKIVRFVCRGGRFGRRRGSSRRSTVGNGAGLRERRGARKRERHEQSFQRQGDLQVQERKARQLKHGSIGCQRKLAPARYISSTVQSPSDPVAAR